MNGAIIAKIRAAIRATPIANTKKINEIYAVLIKIPIIKMKCAIVLVVEKLSFFIHCSSFSLDGNFISSDKDIAMRNKYKTQKAIRKFVTFTNTWA